MVMSPSKTQEAWVYLLGCPEKQYFSGLSPEELIDSNKM
jgi:hypothetical protein